MRRRRPSLPTLGSLFALLALGAAGCAGQPTPPPTPTKTPSGLVAAPSEIPQFETPTVRATPTEPATPTSEFSPTPEATGTELAAPTWTPPPTQAVLPPDRNHQWLQRPIPPETEEGGPLRNFVDRTYPYGGTAGGQYRVHHGYEFLNPRGTAIIAPAEGTVAYAGDDNSTQFGPDPFYYGKLVVLQLNALDPASGDAIFTLFGHMDSIEVETGDTVEAGDLLGTIGSTGVAYGAHLHFEVRLGDMYDFESTRNADFWLAPFFGFGTLAGQVVDGAGHTLYGVAVTVRDMDGVSRYTWTYGDDSVTPDNVWGENFSLGDLPEGYYRVYVNHPSTGKAIEDLVFIEPGKITWVELVVE